MTYSYDRVATKDDGPAEIHREILKPAVQGLVKARDRLLTVVETHGKKDPGAQKVGKALKLTESALRSASEALSELEDALSYFKG